MVYYIDYKCKICISANTLITGEDIISLNMGIAVLRIVLVFIAQCVFFASADPCRTNFGNCDNVNGLCWGTGRDTHFCSCRAGYRADENLNIHICFDVDECSEGNVCGDNSICENTVGSYTCHCRCGYVMDYTGQNCLEASEIDGLCEPPLTCDRIARSSSDPATRSFHIRHRERYITNERTRRTIDNPVTRECQCETGFELNNCGYCVDIDECFTERPCTGFGSTCINTEGSFYCQCDEGLTLGPCNKRCYRREETIPLICEEPDLEQLDEEEVAERDYLRPIALTDWRTCSQLGKRTKKKFDLNHDDTKEMRLMWLCERSRFGGLSNMLILAAEEKARWEPWTCWTACKATCWGGLQTRVRKCLNGLPGVGGCKGTGSQKRGCYNGDKCEFRHRKNGKTLTQAEQADLLQAMEKYKEDMSATGFFNAAAAHGWPNQCDRRMCCIHSQKIRFLAWHRSIVLNYEEGLRRHLNDKTLGLPYWDWLEDDKTPPDIAWRTVIDGRRNPFAHMTVRIDWPADQPSRGIRRDSNVNIGMLESAANGWNSTISFLNFPYSQHEFAESLESAHNTPHVSVCRSGCTISLGSLRFAGFDPLFMFHHTQIDRLWAIGQRNLENKKRGTWTAQIALEAMEDEGEFGRKYMPFANETLNAFPIVQAVNTMRDSYYYEELTGVKYDNLENNGFPLRATASRAPSREGGVEMLFIAQYLQSVEDNVYVNYYRVSGDTSCSRLINPVARTTLLGTDNIYNTSVPRLTPTDRLFPMGGEFSIKACYTRDSVCRSRCAEVFDEERVDSMPDPFLVHYLPNQPVDVYKFQWDVGRKFPAWYVNMDAGFQWIYFFGDRVSAIRQVRSPRAWENCDSSSGRSVPCTIVDGNACLLRSGRYFLIDANPDNCRAGMKLNIISRK